MSAYTEGPWTVRVSNYPHNRGTTYIKPGGSRDFETAIATVHKRGDVIERSANARLIAAAPSLLEALQRVLATNNGGVHGENIDGWLDARKDAVDAIARARVA